MNKMTNEQYLRGFEYSIVDPKRSFNKDSQKENAHQKTLLEIKIDFHKGRFYLQGDWKFLMETNESKEDTYLDLHESDVNINMRVYPEGAIHLEDFENDGGILFLQGKVKNEYHSNSCTGMLIISRNTSSRSNVDWFIIIYLYEYNNAFAEFKYTFPLYLNTLKLSSNFMFPG